MKQKFLRNDSSTVPNFLYFNEIWNMEKVRPRNMHFFTLFVKLIKSKFLGNSSVILQIIKIKQKTWRNLSNQNVYPKKQVILHEL